MVEEKIINLTQIPQAEASDFSSKSFDNTLIGLDTVSDICKKYVIGEISVEELKNFANKLFIKRYLPLKVKCDIISYLLIVDKFLSLQNSTLVSMEFELKKFYRIFLGYTNINVWDFEDQMTIENYDNIMICFGDAIYSIIANDYTRFISMLNDVLNFSNISNLFEYVSGMDQNNSKTLNKDLKKTMQIFEENKETLNKILEIIKFNSPSVEN